MCIREGLTSDREECRYITNLNLVLNAIVNHLFVILLILLIVIKWFILVKV